MCSSSIETCYMTMVSHSKTELFSIETFLQIWQTIDWEKNFLLLLSKLRFEISSSWWIFPRFQESNMLGEGFVCGVERGIHHLRSRPYNVGHRSITFTIHIVEHWFIFKVDFCVKKNCEKLIDFHIVLEIVENYQKLMDCQMEQNTLFHPIVF